MRSRFKFAWTTGLICLAVFSIEMVLVAQNLAPVVLDAPVADETHEPLPRLVELLVALDEEHDAVLVVLLAVDGDGVDVAPQLDAEAVAHLAGGLVLDHNRSFGLILAEDDFAAVVKIHSGSPRPRLSSDNSAANAASGVARLETFVIATCTKVVFP